MNYSQLHNAKYLKRIDRGFGNVPLGFVGKITGRHKDDDGNWMVKFNNTFGVYLSKYFRPATREEYEKWKLVEALS